MEPELIADRKRDISMMFPIVGSQIKRIGWIRVIAGGLSMYLCIPMLVTLHLSTTVALYQWLLRPLLNLPRVRWKDHVIIDRHRITALPWFDRFNCMFCGYANGLCTMMNKELDHLAQFQGELSAGRLWLSRIGAAVMLLVGLVMEVNFQIIYNILVSRPLGMHRVSAAEVDSMLTADHYGAGLPAGVAQVVRYNKNLFLRFSLGLEQIESSWCPLVHFERREGIVYPDHHRRFFRPDQIEEMRLLLSSVGTVSERKPTW